MYSTSFNKTTTFLNHSTSILCLFHYRIVLHQSFEENAIILGTNITHLQSICVLSKPGKKRYTIASFLYNLDRKVSNLIKLLWELFLFHFGQRKFFIRATVQGYEKLTMIMMSSSLFLHGLKRKS